MTLQDLNKITDNFRTTQKMPVLFIGHGSPMNAIEENEFVRGWRSIAQTVPHPQAILCVSAHWETKGTFVTAMEKPQTIHDFGGFPRELYSIRYPAPGSPELAAGVVDMVKSVNVEPDMKWGLDHGCWSVVKHMFPEADVPVIQMSLDHFRSPGYHYELARELSSLREKGILILGSGNLVHNLGQVAWNRLDDIGFGYDWALEANDKMKEFILKGDHKSLIDYKSQGQAFNLAIPTPDHFLPILYTLALKEGDEQITFYNDKAVAGSLTMTCVKIG